MRKFFAPLLIVTALLLAYAPVMIANALFESTMGLVQKIFYFHVPSWFAMFTAVFVSGIASAVYLFKGQRGPTDLAFSAAEIAVLFGADRAGHRSALGEEGVGRLVDLGCQADDCIPARDDVPGLPAGAEVRRARLREARGGDGDLRHGERAVRLLRREHLADHPSADHGGADAAPGMRGAFWYCVTAFMLLFLVLLTLRTHLEHRRAMLDDLYLAEEDGAA